MPHLEAGVAGAEIEFLLVTRAVGNVALAIDAGDLAVGSDHRQAVVIMRPVEPRRSWSGSRSSAPRRATASPARTDARRSAGPSRKGSRPRPGRNRGLRTVRAGGRPPRPWPPPRARARKHSRILASISSPKASWSAATLSSVMRWYLLADAVEASPPVRIWSARMPIATRSGKRASIAATAARQSARHLAERRPRRCRYRNSCSLPPRGHHPPPPAQARVRSLPCFGLDVFGNDVQSLCLRETLSRSPLRLNSEAGPLLLLRGDSVVGDSIAHTNNVPPFTVCMKL